MTTTKMDSPKIGDGSQAARILHALRTGKWVSIAEIQRHTGPSRLNSRIADLRKRGFEIEHRVVKGKSKASLRHQYRLLNPPEKFPDPGAMPRDDLDRDATPRNKEKRFRIYIVNETNELLLMATAATEEQVGVEICKLGREGKLAKACLGLLDTYGIDSTVMKGNWLANPWDPKIT